MMGGGRMDKNNYNSRSSSSSFVYNDEDDGENCKYFVWVDEAEELGYFKNNGAGHGRTPGAVGFCGAGPLSGHLMSYLLVLILCK
ncbi:hypothetical protein MTR_5g080220 [Medicago truncatula]|uniref:Uncharacterized protein n=1 Tax=Medicago truncatula TaxID=3880 RepID=G7KGR2_MEDTR|nr:hypothetical protein MTR_5g080220 [Medicago truncatula]